MNNAISELTVRLTLFYDPYAATNHLINTGLLNLTTRVYPLFRYNNPADQRSLDITVQHLLDHEGGFDRSVSPDLGFVFTDLARSLNQARPATLQQVIEWVVVRPLDFTPGTMSAYSNYGTMLLSYIVTYLTDETYLSYLGKKVLENSDVELWGTASELHNDDAIVQETKAVGISALMSRPFKDTDQAEPPGTRRTNLGSRAAPYIYPK